MLKMGIFQNPHSEVYFMTIRGLIVVNHHCTLIEIITNLFLLYSHPDLIFLLIFFFHLRVSMASIAYHSKVSSTLQATTGTSSQTFALAQNLGDVPCPPTGWLTSKFGQPVCPPG